MVAQCSVHADRICQVSAAVFSAEGTVAGSLPNPDSSLQDRDECLEIPDLCKTPQKCLNTPGGTPAATTPLLPLYLYVVDPVSSPSPLPLLLQVDSDVPA